MASGVFPATSGGGIKLVQRGNALSAGTVTITAVDTAKSFVNVFGTASTGTVAASGSINAMTGTINAANGSLSASTGANATMNMNQGNNNPRPGATYTGATPSSPSYGTTSGWKINSATINANEQNVGLNATNAAFNSTNIVAGSNNLVAAVVQGYLSSSTSLEVSGPCRWEVVEFA